MSSPHYALQVAARSALLGDSALLALLGGSSRVFDFVPADVTYPFIRLDHEALKMNNSCVDMSEVNLTVHIYSRSVGREEAWSIAERVRAVLDAALTVSGFFVVSHDFTVSRFDDDPDVSQTHGILEFRYELEPSS